MTKYITQERAKYWPVSLELMSQYCDGSHNIKYMTGGTLAWVQNGQHHRDGDKPAYIDAGGGLQWCQNNLLHRDGDKPAIIRADGQLQWWKNGRRHRFSGPAIIWADGTLEWWINGEEITQEVNEWLAGEEWQGTPEQIERFQRKFL